MSTSPPLSHIQSVARSQATVVPILGMHRSGTSMVTRALNLLGLPLGQPLIKPQEDNPKGFWENEFFYEVDLRLLHAMGRHVSGYGTLEQLLEVPGLSYQVERSSENLDVLESYVTEQFSTSTLWGWKDPRTVLLFPFWLNSLTELGFRRILPAIISRHPWSVVHSLSRRTDLEALAPTLGCSVEELALQMWTAYSHILLDISDETNCLISPNEWYHDERSARSELTRCCDYLGIVANPANMDQALAWLDPGAIHHREIGSLEALSGGREALQLHEDLSARARIQRATWRLSVAA
jgi:hypothetical protein